MNLRIGIRGVFELGTCKGEWQVAPYKDQTNLSISNSEGGGQINRSESNINESDRINRII